MAFKSTKQTHTFVGPVSDPSEVAQFDSITVMEDWQPGSFWTLRATLTGNDEDAIAAMAKKTVVDRINRRETRRLLREGQDLEAIVEKYVRNEDIMSAETATLVHMSITWGGGEFTVPADEDDPHAGKVPPCDATYIGLQEPFVRSEVYREMSQIWAGKPLPERKEDQDALFRVPRPISEGKRPGKVRVSGESPS